MLKVGDRIPDFELMDGNGHMVCSKDILSMGPAVIYFYPHDDTPACTAEACSFRDAFEYFTDAGAQVVGINSDSPESHRRFAEKHHLPFILLSDGNGEVRRSFGVRNSLGFLPGRVTFVVDGDGMVLLVFDSQFRVQEHVSRSLGIIKGLAEKVKS
jgi:peroxiredoxin Q/BCP